jgi:hypothetical protein
MVVQDRTSAFDRQSVVEYMTTGGFRQAQGGNGEAKHGSS